MKKTLALGAFFILGMLQVAISQDHSELDPVTVTTSMAPEKVSRTGRNVIVIRGERFQDLPVHSIDELLRYLPGIEMQSRGPLGAQSDIVLRGGTFQQVLVILDGLRLNDPNTGHFSGYIPIAPTEIDRIEILKGASSAVYGSEAVGGVIHIITKTFAARKGQPKTNASAAITLGEYNLVSGNAGVFHSNGRTALGAGFLGNHTSGQPQRGTKGFVHANTASLSFSHYFNENYELKMRYAYDDRKFAAQNFYTSFTSDTASERVTSFWNQVSVVRYSEQHRLSLHLGYKSMEDEYRFNPSGLPNESLSKMLQAMITDELKIGKQTRLVTGAQFISKRIISNDRGRHRVDQAAGFAVMNQQFGKNFHASPALRLEWNQRTGWELIPQINLSWHISQVQLRASAGKTIRDADFTERFNNYNKPFVASGRIGNPDLSPERSLSYEAGADYFAGSSLKLSATFFQRFHSRLIDYVPTSFDDMPRQVNLSPTGSFALARNIAEVNTTGVEADLQWMGKLSGDRQLWVSAGMVWLESRSSETTPSLYISSHARFMANFNLSYESGRFRFHVNGLYKAREPQSAPANIAKVSKDYFVMNARAEALFMQKKMGLFVQSDNIFNVSYADLLGAQMPGRWLMGGIRITLSK